MDDKDPPAPGRATREQRQLVKTSVLDAIEKIDNIAAIDAGEVLVSIGAAMMKGGHATEEQFLGYCGRVWAAQQPKTAN